MTLRREAPISFHEEVGLPVIGIDPGPGYWAITKYADIDHWLRVNRERVQDLKLHRCATKHVVDLGCGGGFFLFILKGLGHSVLGLDVDESPLADYAPIREFFRITRS